MQLRMSRTLRFLVVLSLNIVSVSCSTGTTANIETIFLGRCYDYVQINSNGELLGRKNCSLLFNTFARAFTKNTSCSTNYTGIFNRFFQQIDPGPTPEDKALFWSGTNAVAHGVSSENHRYLTLEDTFPGYVVNKLKFCGENASGFNYEDCSCPWDKSQEKVFWTSASTQFAKNAKGLVSVLVNGTRKDGQPAFRNTSIFATVELPNLNVKQVKHVRILVGMDLDTKPKEKCGQKSIAKLQKLIEARNMSVTCVDDPRVVFFVLCTKFPQADACDTMIKRLIDDSKKLQMWKIVSFSVIGTCGLLIIILIVILCRKKKNYANFK